MKLAQIYSHFNGLEFLLIHRQALWQEIQGIITEIDADACKLGASKGVRAERQLLYDHTVLSARFSEMLLAHGWRPSRVSHWATVLSGRDEGSRPYPW